MLLDIEGTTTPADFVYKTLFPYAERHVESFLQEHITEPNTELFVRELHEQRMRDELDDLNPPRWVGGSDEKRIKAAVTYCRWLISKDRKCTSLKTLQGKIWEEGYARGELRGEVYVDVPAAFARWRAEGRTVAIYSSGSELAQRLLFGSVASGDLTPFISRYFDTRVGAKADAESYRKIAKELGQAPGEFLFVSDAVKEIEAAAAAAMQVSLCVRDVGGNVSTSRYPVIHSFAQLP